jgi:hypothetical protein
VFIYALFNFVDHFYHLFLSSLFEIHLLYYHSKILYYEIADFWRRHVALIFPITYVSTLGFTHLRPRFWLVLISCVLLIGIFTMFTQEWVVA